MDRLTSMTVFTRVVEARSFAAAARQLRLSPAMASAHVQGLEERLGVRLLHRTTRQVHPTEAGQEFYASCAAVLQQIEEAEQAVSDSNRTPRGWLRVNASPGFGSDHLAPAIAEFTALHPQVSVELTLTDRVVDLVERGFDLAVRVEPLPDSSLMVRRLATVPMVVCAAPTYLERRGMPLRLDELSAHSCLILDPLSSPHDEWRFVGAGGEHLVVRVAGNLRSNSAAALRAAALSGQGLACLPRYLVGEDLAQKRLIVVLGAFQAEELAISVVHPHRRQVALKVRAFIDFLATRISIHRAAPADAEVGRELGKVLAE